MIYYSKGYDLNKQIGEAHNTFIKLIPSNDDWVVIMDGDCCFLTSNYGHLIADAIEKYGDDYSIMGVLTNRVGLSHQTLGGISDNTDMVDHIKIAKELGMYVPIIKECDIVAGFCMIMKKQTWLEVGGFKPSIHFDSDFCKEVKKKGGKIGVIRNIYVWHTYRLGSENPRFDYHHLL